MSELEEKRNDRAQKVRSKWLEKRQKQEEIYKDISNTIFFAVLDEFEKNIEQDNFNNNIVLINTDCGTFFVNGTTAVDLVEKYSSYSSKMVEKILDYVMEQFNNTYGYKCERKKSSELPNIYMDLEVSIVEPIDLL